MRAEVITPWVGDGASIESAHRPKLSGDYQIKIQDTTGQPAENLSPDPNMYVVEITCSQATLDAIEIDPTYHVQWSEV